MISYYVSLFLLYMIFGLCIGSFLNVVIYRLPIKMSVSKGRSICTSCRHTLNTLDLIPVLSFIFLKGKCRYCKTKISFRYPAVELLTGVLFGICGLIFSTTLYSVLACLFVSALITAAFIDHDVGLIPNGISAFIVALTAAQWFVSSGELSLKAVLDNTVSSVISGGCIFAFMLILYYAAHAVGGGDVKLAAACGLFLGFPNGIAGFLLSYVLAALLLLLPIVRGRVQRKAQIKMAPYFAAGFIAAALFADYAIKWYLTLL